MSVNSVNSQSEIDGLGLTDASNIYDNVVSTSKVHAIIDLTENSNIGKYIRRHALNELFPEAPLKVNFNRNEFTSWNGISIDNGEFTSKSVFFHEDLLIRDKSIMEFENIISNGFQNHGIVCANILNLEFLFNDIDADKYEINRYFGMYCNAEDIGKFKIDSTGLFNDKTNEYTQVPTPKISNTIGYQENLISQIQSNINGIKLYTDVQSGVIPKAGYFNNKEYPRFGFVKDKNGKIYSVKNGGLWADDTEIRIDDTSIDWKDFTGFDSAIDVISAKTPDVVGRPSTKITSLP